MSQKAEVYYDIFFMIFARPLPLIIDAARFSFFNTLAYFNTQTELFRR